jgi:chromosome segregation ATPase
LHNLKKEIASAKALLNSYNILCERKREEAANLNNEISRLEAIISRFKNNKEKYLKIQQTVENKVRSVLTDGKVLLQFALASVIEAIRINPDKYNNLLFSDTSSSTAMPAQQSSLLHVKDYMEKVLEKANRLYDTVQNHLTNSIMDNAAGVSSSDSKLSSIFNLGPYNRNDICRIEDPEIFHNSNGDIDN